MENMKFYHILDDKTHKLKILKSSYKGLNFIFLKLFNYQNVLNNYT